MHLKKQRAKANYKRCISSENRALFIVNACFPPSFNDYFLNTDDLCGWAEQMSFLIVLEICLGFFFLFLFLFFCFFLLLLYPSLEFSVSVTARSCVGFVVCLALQLPLLRAFLCRPLHTIRGLPNSVIISPLH